jgi:ankyrin repeat protein
MKNEYTDLHRILGGLLLFCVLSALFYIEREKKASDVGINTAVDAQAQTESNAPIASEISSKKLLKELSVLIQSHSINDMAQTLAELPVQQARALIKELIQNGTVELTVEEKLHLLLAIAANYSQSSAEQKEIFNLLLEHASLFNSFSPVYYAATHGYSSLIASIAAWSEEQKNHEAITALLINGVFTGLQRAIEHNNLQAAQNIVAQKVPITKDQATELLWSAVKTAKNPAFVPLLQAQGADINFVFKGYSLLHAAVETKNLELVKAVRQANSRGDINVVYAPEVGTALQLAVGMGLADIDEYLRSQGARE